MFIKDLNELKENMVKLDNYLSSNGAELSFAKELIKNGTIFVYDSGRFYPSRWLGYLNNNMNIHIEKSHLPESQKNDPDRRNGIKTTIVISKILNLKPLQSDYLDELYKDYCSKLGVKANKKKHKYWTFETIVVERKECTKVKEITDKTILNDFVINKDVAKQVLSQLAADSKYNKAFDPNNKNGYVYIGKKLDASIVKNDVKSFKKNLKKFCTSVNGSNHTHLYGCDKDSIVNEMQIEDFKNLIKSFNDGFEIMKRVQNKCSRSVYSFLSKLFNTYCKVSNKGNNIYPKYDNVVREYLPKYYLKYLKKDIVIGTRLNDYPNYTKYVTDLCEKCGVTKDELDRIIWYKNK